MAGCPTKNTRQDHVMLGEVGWQKEIECKLDETYLVRIE